MLKKLAPNSRSAASSTRATVITGMANTSRTWVTNTIQVNTGMRISVMPGARMLSTVTVRLMALTSDAVPVMSRPMAKKSTPWVGEKTTPLLGA